MSDENENQRPATGEFLLLSDGTLLVHNLTPAMAEVLACVNAANLDLQARLGALSESGNNHQHAEPSSGN